MSNQMTAMELRHEDIHWTIMDERNQKILAWLTPVTFSARQQDIIRLRTENTGMWLLESSCQTRITSYTTIRHSLIVGPPFGAVVQSHSSLFTSWINGSDKVLFCHGIPGAGKTVLAAIVVEYLQSTLPGELSAVAYIYCNYKERVQQTSNDLIASLIPCPGKRWHTFSR